MFFTPVLSCLLSILKQEAIYIDSLIIVTQGFFFPWSTFLPTIAFIEKWDMLNSFKQFTLFINL